MTDAPSARRYDLLAAGVATFVSVLALAVSAYSTYWQRQATRATTWPRLTQHHTGSLSGDTGYRIELANTGTGPLEIRSLVLRVDGEPVRTLPDLFERVQKLRPGEPTKDATVDVSAQIVSSLAAGEKVELLRIDDKQTAAMIIHGLVDGKRRFVVSACYCSLLGECWTTDGGVLPAIEVSSCPLDADDALRTLGR